MTKSTKRDGTVVEWSGLATCYCTECEIIFNSPEAFDAHLKRKRGRGNGAARHDYSKMPVSAKGYRITSGYKGPGSATKESPGDQELAAED